MGVECYGIEAHPFIFRVAKAKLLYRTDPDEYLAQIGKVINCAENLQGCVERYPKLIRECFSDRTPPPKNLTPLPRNPCEGRGRIIAPLTSLF